MINPVERSTTTASGEWYRQAVFYEVPVPAFFDSDGDGHGDLKGLEQKLDYVESLGVTALWLLPIFRSPGEDDGYDVSDFRSVDPSLGTLEDFRRIVSKLHSRNLRIVLELPINRTSVEHPWFQLARRTEPGSPFRDFYVWRQEPADAAANISDSEPGADRWSWDLVAQAFYYHRFSRAEPDLNLASESVRRELVDVLRFWARLGVDGFSLSGMGGAPATRRESTSNGESDERRFVQSLEEALRPEFPELLIVARGERSPGDPSANEAAKSLSLLPQPEFAATLFLALRRQDRTPLVELFHPLPSANEPRPLGLTWLRDHDEMALSVASDDEEDFLVESYARDMSHKVSGGIARRLAPMVNHDRRQIELLLSLLVALPGVPLLYYGDELGMGDHPRLGDRRGIRTPFPWSDGPNGGFSEANAEQLSTPLVADPVGGFRAVNAARLRRDPYSLLAFVQSLLKIRGAFSHLSDGPLQVLNSGTAEVLAFQRKAGPFAEAAGEGADTLLVAANLSGSARAFDLDLAEHSGQTPTEVFGNVRFPSVDRNPYRLTLPPYGVLWLRFHSSVTRVEPTPSEGSTKTNPPNVPLWTGEPTRDWKLLLAGERRSLLEQEILPADLPNRRWFGAKTRRIEQVQVADWWPLPDTSAVILFARVRYRTGPDDLYLVPLSILPPSRREGTAGPPQIPGAPLALLSDGSYVVDALTDPVAALAFLRMVEENTEAASEAGSVRGRRTNAFPALRDSRNQPLVPRRGPETSSNSLVFFGRKLLLKIFRRLETGINPDLEVGRFLTERETGARVPQVAGALEYVASDGNGLRTLGIVQSLVSSQGDGWSHALAELKLYYARAADLGPLDDQGLHGEVSLVDRASRTPPARLVEALGGALVSASQLALRTAELHLALSADRSDSDFSPEPMGREDVAQIAREMHRQFELGRDALQRVLPKLPMRIRTPAERLLNEGPSALEQLEAAEVPEVIPGQKIRIHGDFHLGQVLRVGDDFVLLDFEGEPTRSVSERRAKFSPVRDVAGMLRSYHYAAYAALFDFVGGNSMLLDRLVPWADAWHQWVGAAFVQRYRHEMKGSSVVPAADADFALLLDRYILAKGLYELVYELNNRPDWVRIPLGGVNRLLFPDSASRPLETTTP